MSGNPARLENRREFIYIHVKTLASNLTWG
jgi:hypothetical protein